MVKFTRYHYKDEDDPKFIISLNWFTYEDSFERMYYGNGQPIYDELEMNIRQERNENRHKWFFTEFNFCGFRVQLEIRLKKVGLYHYGKYRDVHQLAQERRDMLERRRARRDSRRDG